MDYNGIEIDMLSLGNADCILVTRWHDGIAERVLIDGGGKSSSAIIRKFLRKHNISYIDHVVCSHSHDDHASGLTELLSDDSLAIGRLWTHLQVNHIDVEALFKKASKYSNLKEAKAVTESLQTHISLVKLAIDRKIPISEPFAGKKIGCLTVCGPSPEFYKDMMSQFADESYYSSKTTLATLLLERLKEQADETSDSLLDSPEADPLNDTSTILATEFDGEIYVFTADAGAQALAAALDTYEIAPCKWMQIPHHGSRRNITQGLIKQFSPKTAFVSAEGSQKHPRRAVVNAFKRLGTKVYSTHYPNGGHLRHHSGLVPERAGYVRATPLWEASK